MIIYVCDICFKFQQNVFDATGIEIWNLNLFQIPNQHSHSRVANIVSHFK